MVKLDRDIHLYLAALMVAALAWEGEILVMPEGIQVIKMIRKAFNNMLGKETSCNYNNYRLTSG